MGVKGRLVASMEVKCGGRLIHDLMHTKTHHVANISPSKINRFEVHEGEIGKVGTIINMKYNDGVKVGTIINVKYNDDGQEKIMKYVIEDIDSHKKSISRKVIDGDLSELYSSFTFVSSCEHQWTTWTFEYEKKLDDTPEPLNFMGFLLNVTKDIEGHLLK